MILAARHILEPAAATPHVGFPRKHLQTRSKSSNQQRLRLHRLGMHVRVIDEIAAVSLKRGLQ
jgi:hypothetical protein